MNEPRADIELRVRIGMGAVLLSCGVFAVVRLLVQANTGQATPWWANASGFSVMVALWVWFHRGKERRRTVAAHTTAAVALYALAVPVLYQMPSSIWWMSLIPLSMMLMGGRHEGALWTVITMGTMASLSVLPPTWIVEDAAGEGAVERTLSKAVFVLVLVLVGLSFREEVDERALELERTADALQRANAAKARFLANMSHELRTPLHAVLAMTDLALKGTLSGSERVQITTANTSARLLSGLLDDLLDVSRMDRDPLALHPRPFQLDDLLADVLRPLAVRAEAAGLVLDVVAPEALPVDREGDPNRLAQVLLNLVSNAIKFTDFGRVTVRVDGDGSTLRLDVVDTGRGIPDSLREAVFEPFVQVEAQDAERQAGAGLGLAIVREILVRMGGSIAVDAPETGGTRFRVEAPLPSVSDRSLGNRDLLRPDDVVVSSIALVDRGLRVLVAEDDATSRFVLATLLERCGHDVTAVEDGHAALLALDEAPFDVVLTDLQMPRLDGRRLLQALAVRLDAPPVVVCTAEAGPDERALLELPDVVGLLDKPFTIEGLQQVLETLPPPHHPTEQG